MRKGGYACLLIEIYFNKEHADGQAADVHVRIHEENNHSTCLRDPSHRRHSGRDVRAQAREHEIRIHHSWSHP